MNKIKKSITFLKNNFPQNFFAGVVVSLVALPLGLGLATASGLEPVAGVITAIIGGITVSIFGGSYLTITGPGNSLIPIVLAAIVTLGAGNELLGRILLFDAVIVSGILIFFFGVFRLGTLSSFFPSAAIQGLLAAIGIIILGKQLHVMLGNMEKIEGNTLEIIAKVPSSLSKIEFGEANFYAMIIGCVSFLIMYFHGKIKNRYLHGIPAPMMVLVVTIIVGYFFKYSGTISPFENQNHYLIQIPDNVIMDYKLPNLQTTFKNPELFLSWDFISVVLSLTLISSIESLLSISAVEKLDPMRRKSNVNKDLKALGGASVLSGLVGGLNVVTVIARSSVAVQNGATTRLTNFFHAVILIVFLLFFTPQLNMVAMSSLAAILVYTGYKLALPSIFIEKFKRGLDQFLIFIITIIATLTIGLIEGIITGMISTILFHLFLSKNRHLMLQSLFNPNTLMYQEEDGKYYISVKGFSNFLNFFKLKNKLDVIPVNSHVILDFSLTNFVDLTVKEHVNQYSEIFLRAGGNIEIIGLQGKGKNIQLFEKKKREEQRELSKKQLAIQNLAEKIKYQFIPQSIQNFYSLYNFIFFYSKEIKLVKNIIQEKEKGIRCFETHYSEGEFILEENLQVTFLTLDLDLEIPSFTLDKDLLFDRIHQFSGLYDIKVKNELFDKKFLLKGKSKARIIKLFNNDLIQFLIKNSEYHLESSGKQILILKHERLLSPSQIEKMILFAEELKTIITKNVFQSLN
ncbi:MAG: SulP family inorganic anion transporter [Flavobacteriales bacterium]